MKHLIILAFFCVALARQIDGAPTHETNSNDDLDNDLFPYEPIPNKRNDREPLRPSSSNDIRPQRVPSGGADVVARPVSQIPPGMDMKKYRDISFNSREVRLLGPDGREIEMKEDMPTKMLVAWENLQNEATDVWGKVNDQLDKGWNELKNTLRRHLS